jgi:hypothetical protein
MSAGDYPLFRSENGHSIGSPTTTLPSATSNGNATKYVIPAMAHPFLHDRHFSAASSFQIGVSRGLRMAKRDAGLCFAAMAFDMQLTG